MRSRLPLLAATVLLPACATDLPRDPAGTISESTAICSWSIDGWNTRLQGTDPDPNFNTNEGASAIAHDLDDCGIYVGGDTSGALEDQVALGSGDAYLTRYGTSGGVSWTRQFGSTASDTITGVAVGANHNIVVTGCTSGTITGSPEANAGGSDAFVAKYDADGNQLWIHQLGSTGDDCGYGVAIGGNGGVFITGVARGVLGGAAPYWGAGDAFLAKYSPSGVLQFTKLIGSPDADEAKSIAIGSAGNVFIAGYTREDLLSFTDPMAVSPGRFGGDDIFVGKYDPVTGDQLWLAQRGTGDDERATGIAVNDNNELFVTGWTDGSLDGNIHQAYEDVFVLSYSTSGTWRWTDQRGSTANERGEAIAVDSNGAPYAVGWAMDNIDGQPHEGEGDILILKYSRAGVHRWTTELGEADNERAQGVSISGTDNIFVAGFTNSDLNGVSNNGGNDAFAIRFDSTGAIH